MEETPLVLSIFIFRFITNSNIKKIADISYILHSGINYIIATSASSKSKPIALEGSFSWTMQVKFLQKLEFYAD